MGHAVEDFSAVHSKIPESKGYLIIVFMEIQTENTFSLKKFGFLVPVWISYFWSIVSGLSLCV